MGNIKLFFELVRGGWKSEIFSTKWLAGLTVGAALVGRYQYVIMQFAKQIEKPIQIVEPMIYIANDLSANMFVFLGLILILSDAPFIRPSTIQIIIRVNKRIWITAMIAHVVVISVFYYGVLTLASCLAAITYGFSENLWSIPMQEIAMGNQLATSVYHIRLEYRDVLQMSLPYTMLVRIFMGLVLYGVTVGMIILTFNLNSSRRTGALVGLLFHFINYVGFMGYTKSASLLSYTMVGDRSSYHVPLLVILCLSIICSVKSKFADLFMADEI